MNLFKQTKTKKALSAFAGTVVGLSMIATTANAASLTEDQIQAILGFIEAFNVDQSVIDNVEASLRGEAPTGGSSSTGSGVCSSYTFSTDLELGDTGADVMNLQKVLNMDPDTQVAASGVGSAGNETEYFGSLTKDAVIKFQNKYASEVLAPIGLSAGTGYVGSMSRAKLNTMATCDDSETGDTPGDTTGGDTTPAGASLTVTPLADGVISDGAPINSAATGVSVLKFRLQGSVDTDVTVNGVTVTKVLPGAVTDITSVYLYNGAQRLTSGRTINSSTRTAAFNGLNLTIPAGGYVDLTVKVDTIASASNTAGTHAMAVVSADHISASAAFTGSFPVQGPSFYGVNNDTGAITITRTGTLTNPKVGEQDAKVAEFSLAASSKEDVVLNGITLYSIGGISAANISNFELKMVGSSDVLASVSGIDSKNLVNLVLDTPYTIEKGSTKIFEVYADVSGAARANDTIRLYVDNDADLMAVGATYGFGVGVTRTAYDNTAGDGTDASYTTVEGGQITNVFEGPATTDIATNATDVELFRWTTSAQANVEVRSTGITIAATGDGLVSAASAANYTDIKIIDVATGVVVAGPTDVSTSGSDSSQTLTFTDYYYLNAGQERTFKVTADIANNSALDGDTVTVTLGAFGSSAIKNIDNNTFVSTTDIVPAAALPGNTHNVKTSSLTVAVSSTPTSQTYIKGSSFSALGINLKAGTAGDVRVSSLTIQAYVDNDTSGTFDEGAQGGATSTDIVLSANLWDGSTQVGTSKSPTTSTAAGNGGVLSFTNLNYTVPAGTTKTLVLKVNTPSTATAGERIKFGVTAISAQDVDGNSVSATNNAGNSTTSDAGVRLTIAGTGTLTAVKAADDSESEQGIVVAGTSNVVLGKYRLTAQNEELKVTKAQIDLVTAANYASIISVTLYDGATAVSETVNMDSSGSVQFSSVNFVVPKDDSKTLTVKANLNTVSGGATSGADLKVELEDDNFEARGTNSSTVLTSGNVTLDINGNSKITRKTNVTLTQNTTSNQLTSSITSGAEHGLYAFDVAVDSQENAALRQMKFQVTLTDNVGTNDTLTATSFKLFRGSTDITSSVDIVDEDGDSIESGGLAFAEASSTVVVIFGGSTGEESINKGTTNTYTLKATLNGFATGADNDSITVQLLSDSSAQPAAAKYIGADANSLVQLENSIGGDATAANIIWSDNAVIPHLSDLAASSSADWINGYLLKNTPLGSRSINN